LANAEIVIQEWIETAIELGRPIPEPEIGRLETRDWRLEIREPVLSPSIDSELALSLSKGQALSKDWEIATCHLLPITDYCLLFTAYCLLKKGGGAIVGKWHHQQNEQFPFGVGRSKELL